MKVYVPISFLCIAALIMTSAAQEQEYAHIVRKGTTATLTASGPRPVDFAARKLVEEFGVAISVEDPLYLFRDDVVRVGTTRAGEPLLVPKPSSFDMTFDIRPDGSVLDWRQVVATLAHTANDRLPFGYRVDRDGQFFSVIPTRTRDGAGRHVQSTPVLDRHVTIAPGTRRIFEHVQLLVDSLQQQTGLRISCCQSFVSGIPWGSTVVSFEARDEPARHVLLQLLRLEPGRGRLSRNAPSGAFQFVPSSPEREHWFWTMRCQPGAEWCFINVGAIPEKL